MGRRLDDLRYRLERTELRYLLAGAVSAIVVVEGISLVGGPLAVLVLSPVISLYTLVFASRRLKSGIEVRKREGREGVELDDAGGHGPFDRSTYADRIRSSGDLTARVDDRERALVRFCIGMGVAAGLRFLAFPLYG